MINWHRLPPQHSDKLKCTDSITLGKGAYIALGGGGYDKELSIEEPRIVNGLQTSMKIAEYFKTNPPTTPTRYVSVKIIQSDDVSMQDRIIKATNSQTKIPIQFLYASDETQRDIEQYFRSIGLHYARRKNSWRKEDIQIEAVIGMTDLAQAVASVHLQEPDHARARPSRYFKKEHYRRIFSGRYPLSLYAICADVKKRVEKFLRAKEGNRLDRNNLLFYVAMASVCIYLKTPRATVKSPSSMDASDIPEATFEAAWSMVRPIYERHGTLRDDGRTICSGDVAAKGTEMIKELKAELVSGFSKRKRGKAPENRGKEI